MRMDAHAHLHESSAVGVKEEVGCCALLLQRRYIHFQPGCLAEAHFACALQRAYLARAKTAGTDTMGALLYNVAETSFPIIHHGHRGLKVG